MDIETNPFIRFPTFSVYSSLSFEKPGFDFQKKRENLKQMTKYETYINETENKI